MRKPVFAAIAAAAVSAAAILYLARPSDLDRARDAYSDGDFATARTILQPLAEGGDADAEYRLAKLYESGYGVPADRRRAFDWYRKAADQQHHLAEYRLARLISYDHTLLADLTDTQQDAEAARLFRLAAEAGVAPAQAQYGYFLAIGRGLPPDTAAALVWSRRAAEQGDPDGAYDLGRAYDEGDGVPQDKREAAKWYLKAAVQHPGGATQMSARRLLQKMWEHGTGPWRDAEEYVAWLASLANLGDVEAQLELGQIYEDGKIVPANLDTSTQWYLKAATGNPQALADKFANAGATSAALYKVATFYLAGDRLPKNPFKAMDMLSFAVVRNNVHAQLLLGSLYMDGDVTERDDRRAWLWLQLASRHQQDYAQTDANEARARIGELVQRMTADDLAAARIETEEWQCRTNFCGRTD